MGPDFASTDEVLLHRPGFRTLLIEGSKDGLRFYPHNTEQAFPNTTSYNDGSDIRMELFGVDAKWADLGAGCCVTEIEPLFNGKVAGGIEACQEKCESVKDCGYLSAGYRDGTSSLCTIWPESTKCSLDAGGEGHCGSRGDDGVHTFRFTGGFTEFLPSSFRIQRSSRVTLANVVNSERTVRPTKFVSAGNGYDPNLYNMILYQDGEGVCDPNQSPESCSASAVMDRPVLWRWSGGEFGATFSPRLMV